MIQEMFEELFSDWKAARKINDSELEAEMQRAKISSERATPLLKIAEIKANMYLKAGVIMADNILVSDDEVKLMSPASRRMRLRDNNLIDELAKK